MRSGKARLARTLLGLAVAAALLPSCGGGGGGGGGGFNDSFDRQAFLTSIASTQAIPAYQDFLTKANALAAACDAYATEMTNNGPGPAATTLLTAAQTAWAAAQLSWSSCDLFQFGPAGATTIYKGGINLRDEIYAWPFSNPCEVDKGVVANTFTTPGYFYGSVAVNAGGLATVEYLLFYSSTTSSCSSPPVGWVPASVDVRRAQYASAAADDVAARAQSLVDTWTGSFLAKFNNAAGSGVYASAHDAVNEVFWSLFYFDLFCKDKKIAHPLGLNDFGTLHPELVESRFGGTSIPQLKRNLQVFETAFLGAPAGSPAAGAALLGFDDFLIARGGSALAATMVADIAAARVAMDAVTAATVTDALNDVPVGSQNQLLAAHAALKKVTDNLKTQFVTILNLSVPATGAGDND